MKRQKSEERMSNWWLVLLGASFSVSGTHSILTGKPTLRWGVEIPAWTGWVELPFGLWATFLGIRALWRDRKAPPKPPEPPVNIDEAAARAEAAMDAMYLRAHGKLPEKPKKDT